MCNRKNWPSDDKILQFLSFFRPWGLIMYFVLRRRTGENINKIWLKISDGYHMTPALISRIGSCDLQSFAL